MFGYPKWRAWTVIIVSVLGLFFAVPNFMPASYYKEHVPAGMQRWWRPMTLGLDLQGGSHLLLEVKMDDLVKDSLGTLADGVRSAFSTEKITDKIKYKDLLVKNGVLQVKILDASKKADAKKRISDLDKGLNIEEKDGYFFISYSDEALTEMRAKAVAQSIEIVRRRIDDMGTKEPSIQQQGEDRIVLQLPGVQNPEEVKNLLGKTAKMTFHLVDEETSLADAQRGKIPQSSVRMSNKEGGYIIIKRAVSVGGDQLESAKLAYDENRQPVVSFAFKNQGARRFAETTRDNIGRRLAIVLDGEVISAPVIKSEIKGPGTISGNFTIESAEELALLLRSGALPAPLEVVEERTVGAGLGEDSIKAGMYACLIGAVLVFAFMLWVYGWFGMFANVALAINVFLIFSILSAFGATLTLPGLAGIALTIGMAVDANVLIYARMREEAALGRSPLQVINTGFDNAFTAIVDSQITTFFAAVVLFFMGAGPVKGFSVTLGVGVFTSLFTAILITKFLIMIWYTLTKPKTINL